jgi:hypothetical protein
MLHRYFGVPRDARRARDLLVAEPSDPHTGRRWHPALFLARRPPPAAILATTPYSVISAPQRQWVVNRFKAVLV